jgi:hypothetical protein
MKPPVGNTLPKTTKLSPLSKITEKDDTHIAPTESFDFSVRMGNVDEGSRELSVSYKNKSSVEKTERLNMSDSEGFGDVNSVDFEEYSLDPPISDHKRLSGRSNYPSSKSCFSIDSAPAHAQR